MAKRKRPHDQGKRQHAAGDHDSSTSKLKFSSYADIGDSEDEFHINRDEIMLDGAPNAKRMRQLEDIIEPSDEEVLAYSDVDSGADSYNSDNQYYDEDHVEQGANPSEGSIDADGSQDHDEIDDWGASKAGYYNADAIETEQDALEEEAEARRLQQKRLKALKKADFGFEETEWLHRSDQMDIEGEDGKVMEVLPELHISADMSPSERLKLLRTRYPELEPLANQFAELQSLHQDLLRDTRVTQEQERFRNNLHGANGSPVQITKFRALSAYLGALAMYFAILTSPASGDNIQSLPLAPHILQSHAVMDSLVHSRKNWEMIKDMEDVEIMPASTHMEQQSLSSSLPRIELKIAHINDRSSKKSTVKPQKQSLQSPISTDTAAVQARRAERLRRAEYSIGALANVAMTPSSRQQRPIDAISTSLTTSQHSDIDSDIGDESALAPHEVAEKARRKKSLRFYTSQIAQRANKRANAGRAAGGDDDVPHRERLRDRQERLMREAENRGKKGKRGLDGTELHPGGDGSDEEAYETNRQQELRAASEDVDVGALEARVLAKKTVKKARASAYAEAKETGGRVVRHEEAGVAPDGRREVGYAIEKNKGLMPRRKKDVKNPRVKKRKKFEEKTKKLHSMKPVYKGGEGRGGYAGELTGIKKGLVRSVKF